MRVLLPVILAVLVLLAVYFAARAARIRTGSKVRWEVKQLDDGGDTLVWVVKGQQRDLIGKVDRQLQDYDDRVIAAQALAGDLVATRNSILDSTPRRHLEV